MTPLSTKSLQRGFRREHYKIKRANCRSRHSRNAVPFARIESAVASMGVNVREARARTRVDRMEFSDWPLYKRVPMTLKCLDGSPPSVNFRRPRRCLLLLARFVRSLA